MSTQTFDWDVELPEGKANSFGARPRGALIITTEERGIERLSLPLSVARSLRAAKAADEIHPGSRAELLWMAKDRAMTCAKSRVERLIDKRDYSSFELAEKLRQDGYSEQVRNAIVERAVEVGLVNDARYADVFVRSKMSSGWGALKIEQELRRRGIEASSIAGWPDAYFSQDAEEERALQIARSRRISDKNGYQKLVRYLCGRGYSLGLACHVAKQVMDERGGSEE